LAWWVGVWLGCPAVIKLRKAPHAKQDLFIALSCLEQLYGGAKRGGKSYALAMKAILLSVLFPGNRGAMYRKTLPDLKESLLQAFWDVLPNELLATDHHGGHHKTDRVIYLRTIQDGMISTIYYGGLGEAIEFEAAKGKTYGWFEIDEPSEIDERIYLQLLAQLTHVLPNGNRPPYMALLGSNPEPGWLEQRFDPEKKHWRMKGDNPERAYIQALPSDNPFLPPGYVEHLLNNYPPEWVKKYVMGSWEVSEGQVFMLFDRPTHCISPPSREYVMGLNLISSIDHAATGVSCKLVVGVDRDDNVIALGEYYRRNLPIQTHAENMKFLIWRFAGMKDPSLTARIMQQVLIPGGDRGKLQYGMDYILIDPACRQRVIQGKGRAGEAKLSSIIDEYRECGISATPAHNAMEAGIERINSHLICKQHHINPFTRQPNAPAFYVVEADCPNLVREMINWQRKAMAGGDIKHVGDDHAIDNLRYIMLSRPRRPEMAPGDWAALLPQERHFKRLHDKWASKFARQDPNPNQWSFTA